MSNVVQANQLYIDALINRDFSIVIHQGLESSRFVKRENINTLYQIDPEYCNGFCWCLAFKY